MRRAFSMAALTAFALGYASAARAECYDVFGCADTQRFQLRDLMSGPNCEFLYTMRNNIYAEHHYCFKTPRAIATFGNAGCISGNPNAIGMNGIELGNAVMILRAEKAKRCPE